MTPEEFERIFRKWEECQRKGTRVFQWVFIFAIGFILAALIWYYHHA